MRASLRQVRAALASAILLVCLPGCRERLVLESAGGVRFALPAWPHRGAQPAPSAGFVERADGKGDRVFLGWDVDARTGKPTFALAREASGVLKGEVLPATVAGHEAWRLSDRALVWRCDKTGRLLRLVIEGEAPPLDELASHVDCHAGGTTANGDVPSASTAALGPAWRFGHRGAEATPQGARTSDGPLGHPALRVSGTARLDGAPVRWTLMTWRCIQRQRSFAALVFARAPSGDAPGDFTGHDGALLAARCHGG